ncbi:serine hydrolase domain-containing protein [Arthrobacter sp. NicSoilC5]|uniref:serine hydrolase n=1 Tax=Arthrobacter sp. NicSoilC5 TaxID=2831000 RepID=UPI001CC718A7|nr:serine hydrolase domain-containing protein [Arthrobacter sp. NicSoilC5]
MQAASVTKTMTAVAVLRFADGHLIGLDDPVTDVFPEFTTVLKLPGPITVRQLLSHTAGMPEADDALPVDVDFRPVLSRRWSVAWSCQGPYLGSIKRRVFRVLLHLQLEALVDVLAPVVVSAPRGHFYSKCRHGADATVFW